MPSYASIGPNGASDCYLLLEDGSIFLGKQFGAHVSVDGEIGEFCIEHVLLFYKSEPHAYTCKLLSKNQLPACGSESIIHDSNETSSSIVRETYWYLYFTNSNRCSDSWTLTAILGLLQLENIYRKLLHIFYLKYIIKHTLNIYLQVMFTT